MSGVAVTPPAQIRAGQRQPEAFRDTRPRYDPGDEWVTDPRRRRSSTRRQAFPVSTRSPGASSSSTRDPRRPGAGQHPLVKTDACCTRPATSPPIPMPLVEVDEITLQARGQADLLRLDAEPSPGLHAVEHPIYDSG